MSAKSFVSDSVSLNQKSAMSKSFFMLVDVNDHEIFEDLESAVKAANLWQEYAIETFFDCKDSELSDNDYLVEREKWQMLDYSNFLVNGKIVDSMIYELTDQDVKDLESGVTKPSDYITDDCVESFNYMSMELAKRGL